MECHNKLDGVEGEEGHDEFLQGVDDPRQAEDAEDIVEDGNVEQIVQWRAAINVLCAASKQSCDKTIGCWNFHK